MLKMNVYIPATVHCKKLCLVPLMPTTRAEERSMICECVAQCAKNIMRMAHQKKHLAVTRDKCRRCHHAVSHAHGHIDLAASFACALQCAMHCEETFKLKEANEEMK
jgi:hypothetical protein